MSGQRCLSCIGRYKDFIRIKKQFHFLFTCFMKPLMISMPADWTGKFIWRCPGLDPLSSVFTFLQQNIVIWKIRVWPRGAVFGALAGNVPDRFLIGWFESLARLLPVSLVTLRHVLGRIALKMKLYAEKMVHIRPKMSRFKPKEAGDEGIH